MSNGFRLSVWLTGTVGVLMVISRRDRPGVWLKTTDQTYPDIGAAMRAGWASATDGAPFDGWRIMGSREI